MRLQRRYGSRLRATIDRRQLNEEKRRVCRRVATNAIGVMHIPIWAERSVYKARIDFAVDEIMIVRFSKSMAALLTLSFMFVAGSAFADPPEHAKAHGWRKKHDPNYVGYTGRQWERDYGIIEGNCNRKEIGTVLGAVVGGAIGSQVGDGSGRVVAIIVGSVLGGVIGREIGRDLDEGDRACVGHALELAKPGHPVRWVNDQSKVSYLLTPLAPAAGDTKDCRRFTIKASRDSKSQTSKGRACRSADGTWKMTA
jgi:surface antigen